VFFMTCFLVNLDLYYILTNPFYPVHKRTIRFWKYILLSSLLYTIIFNLLFFNELEVNSIKSIMKASVRIFLALGNLITSILIFKRLRREGINRKLIRRVLSNWIGMIIISTMSFLVIPACLLVSLFNYGVEEG
jgi:hypothetical protein